MIILEPPSKAVIAVQAVRDVVNLTIEQALTATDPCTMADISFVILAV